MTKLFLITGGLAMLCAGCESSYIYRPDTNATAQVQGQPAAAYPIPSATDPQGDVRIASFGVSKVTPQVGAPVSHALHVRMIVANNGTGSFSVDSREQRIVLDSGEAIRAMFAQSDGADLPVATVPSMGKRTIDLYFPLTADHSKESQIPAFDVIWRIHTLGQAVTERTPFERLNIDGLYASTAWGYPNTYGPYSWSDPTWGPTLIGTPFRSW